MTDKPRHHCLFCGKMEHDVMCLIAGPGSLVVCDECVRLCSDIIEEHRLRRIILAVLAEKTKPE